MHGNIQTSLSDLRQVLRKIRWLCISELSLQAFVVLLSGALLLLLGLYSASRFGLDRRLGLLAAAVPAVLWSWIVLDVASTRRCLSRSSFVLELERVHSLQRGELLSPLQIAESHCSGQPAGAESFVRAAVAAAAELALRLPRRPLGQSQRRPLAGLLLASAAISAVAAFDGGGLYRALAAWGPEQEQAPLYFRLWTARKVVARGESAEVYVRRLVPLQEPLYLSSTEDLGPEARWESRPLTEPLPGLAGPQDQPLYRTQLGPLGSSRQLFVSSGAHSSEILVLPVEDRPRLLRFSTETTFPEYLGQPVLSEERTDGNLTVPWGSAVRLRVESDRPLLSARLLFGPQRTTPKPMQVSPGSMRAETGIEVLDPVFYEIEVTSASGLTNLPVRYYIKPLEDQSPTVRILKPGRDLTVDQQQSLTLDVAAEDDHRVDRMELVFSIDQGPEQSIPLPVPPAQKQRLEQLWDLSALELSFEQEASYYVAVWDNDTLRGPKRGVSATYKLRYPSFYEIYDQAEKQQTQELDSVSGLVEKQKQLLEDLDRMASKLAPEEDLDWKQSEALRDMETRQKEVQSEVQSLAEQLREKVEKLEKDSLATSEILQKTEEISKLFQQLADEDMQKILEQIQEALSKLQLDDEQLAELQKNMSTEQLMQGLDRTLELLRRLEAERQLEALSELAKNLAEQQQKLTESTEKLLDPAKTPSPDPNGPSASAEQLAEQQRQLSPELDALEKQLSKLAESEALQPIAQDLEKLQSQLGDPSEDAEQAGEQLEQQQPDAAAKIQRPLGKRLEDLSAALGQMAERMRGMQLAEILAIIEELVHELADVTRRLDTLRGQALALADLSRFSVLSSAERLSIGHVARELELGHQASRAILERIVELGSKSPELSRAVADKVEAATEELRQAQDSVETLSLGSAATSFLDARVQLHEAAVALLSLTEALSQGMPSAGQSLRESLEQLSEDQRRLAEALRQGQNKGGGLMPVPIPRSMEEMAAEQARIRRQMEQIQQDFEALQGSMGSLEGLEDDMKDLEKQYQNGALDPDAEQKHKKILDKLLEAKESLRERKIDPERESKTGKPLPPEPPSASRPVEDPWEKQLRGLLENHEVDLSPEDRQILERFYLRLAEEGP